MKYLRLRDILSTPSVPVARIALCPTSNSILSLVANLSLPTTHDFKISDTGGDRVISGTQLCKSYYQTATGGRRHDTTECACDSAHVLSLIQQDDLGQRNWMGRLDHDDCRGEIRSKLPSPQPKVVTSLDCSGCKQYTHNLVNIITLSDGLPYLGYSGYSTFGHIGGRQGTSFLDPSHIQSIAKTFKAGSIDPTSVSREHGPHKGFNSHDLPADIPIEDQQVVLLCNAHIHDSF